jgi:hypothetical protein
MLALAPTVVRAQAQLQGLPMRALELEQAG